MIWKRVTDFPRYEVSDYGHVRSYARGKLRLLKPSLNSRGYPSVRLYDDHGGETQLVHLLVLEAFKGPCPRGYRASRLNDDKLNSRDTNLIWEV